MRRSVLGFCALLVVVIVALVWWIQRETPLAARAPNPEPDSRIDPRRLAPTVQPASGPRVVGDLAGLARTLHSPDLTPRDDLDVLQRLLEFYRRANDGANPDGGLNEEFVDALRGQNPKRLAVFPPDHPAIDAQGRLLDRWGTPYFFHPLSREILDIRSAGPDRKLWTSDDVFTEPPRAPVDRR